jgi:hypothetical protein
MGFFKKILGGSNKQEAAPPPAPEAQVSTPSGQVPPEGQALIQKWDQLLGSILQSFDGVLQQALAASEPHIQLNEGGMQQLSIAWGAIEHQMHQHTEKVADGWDEISDEMSDVDDFPEEVLDAQGDKRDLTHCEIEIRYNRAFKQTMARAAEVMRQRAQGNPDAERVFRGSGPHLLGDWQAFPAWERMMRAETSMGLYRDNKDVPMDLLREYEASSREYYSTRLNVEAQYAPEQQQHVAMKLEGYMKSTNKTLRQYWQWREQG